MAEGLTRQAGGSQEFFSQSISSSPHSKVPMTLSHSSKPEIWSSKGFNRGIYIAFQIDESDTRVYE